MELEAGTKKGKGNAGQHLWGDNLYPLETSGDQPSADVKDLLSAGAAQDNQNLDTRAPMIERRRAKIEQLGYN